MLVPTPSTAVSASAPVQARATPSARSCAVGDHLGQHRVVVAADRHPRREAGVDADVRSGRLGQRRAPARRSAGSRGRDPRRRRGPRWRGRAAGCRPGDGQRSRPAAMRTCHSTRSTPGDHLGDRMFDLQAGVHLHEEELVGPVGGHDELDGARADVVDAPRGVAGGGADPRAGGRVEQRRRRLLDDLLVAALQAALALAEVQHGAVGVGEHLDLDVPGAQHEPLQEQRVVAEGRRGLAAGRGQRGRQVGGVARPAHALAAATGGRLDQHGEADVGGRGDQIGVGESGLGDTGNHRHPERRHRCLGGDLVAHRLDRDPAGGPMNDHTGGLQCGGEVARSRRGIRSRGGRPARRSAPRRPPPPRCRGSSAARAAARSAPRRRPRRRGGHRRRRRCRRRPSGFPWRAGCG